MYMYKIFMNTLVVRTIDQYTLHVLENVIKILKSRIYLLDLQIGELMYNCIQAFEL
jgi:hypothetical protein